MSKYPDKVKARAVRELDRGSIDRVEPESPLHAFSYFRYSYREMSMVGGRTHVKAKEIRVEDGRVKSEEFEGTLGPALYERTMMETQRLFLEQTTSFLKAFALFLPSGKNERGDKE